MKAHKLLGFCWTALLVVGVFSTTVADQYSYTEDFTTTTYKDTLNTTALWDTVAGELKLAPFELALAGGYDTPGTARGVAVSGDYAFVADQTSGLQVIDISDPTNPSLTGSYDTPGSACGVAISGDYAYVADHGSGLHVIDISDPANPSLAGSYNTSGNADGVSVSGDYAYVSDGSFGLQVIDISDPTNPSLAGSYTTPGTAIGVTVSGNYAYVADHVSGLTVIDVSDPPNPSFAGSYNTPGNSWAVAISGDYAYVADEGSGLQVIDISDPTSPSLAGTYDTPGTAYGVSVTGDYAYVSDFGSGLHAIDISDPANPALLESYVTPGTAMSSAIAGEYAYVADMGPGLQVIDICDFKFPALVGSYDTPGYPAGVAISGDYAYVADQNSGLQVIDISNPTSPMLAGSYDTPGSADDVAVSGDYAYVADWTSGLQVIDISNPANPTLAGTYATTINRTKRVIISGDYAYVADRDSGFVVIDISDPTSPTRAGRYDIPGSSYGVTISGDYAYVADHLSWNLQILDISDPTSPMFAGVYDTPSTPNRMAVSGDYLFVAVANSGLLVVDISNPTSPTLTGSYDTPSNAYNVAISGDYAYVADETGGLQVIDISDPTNPTYAGSYDVPGFIVRYAAVSGDYAFVTDVNYGLKVVWIFQRFLIEENNKGQSVQINSSVHDIGFVKLSSAQTDSIRWEVSANGGTNWQEVPLNNSWNIITNPGIDLRWRSTHEYTVPFVNPTCSNLAIEWLSFFPIIETITDIPNDQGGQVSISWTRSGYDHVGSSTPVTEYAIYRKIDHDLSASPDAKLHGKSFEDKPTIVTGPRFPHAYPPGDWHFLMTVPADCEDTYATVVSTLADSTITEGMYYTTFFVSALTATPGVYFDSPPDSGYSLDNLAPGVPMGLTVVYNMGSGNELTWEECPDEDFKHFHIYRGETEDFEPSPETLVQMTIETGWLDTIEEGWRYHYKITAVDDAGNESDASSAGTVAGNNTPTLPTAFALYQNAPNPFNPTSTIRFDLPVRSRVKLVVYNVSGQLVRVLLDRDIDAGCREVRWDGADSMGRGVASGVYFYRLDTPTFSESRKMILLR